MQNKYALTQCWIAMVSTLLPLHFYPDELGYLEAAQIKAHFLAVYKAANRLKLRFYI